MQEFADLCEVINCPSIRSLGIQSRNKIRGRNERSFDLAIAYKINWRHNHQVGVRKTLRKLFEQEARSTVLMRLKNTDDSPRILSVSQRSQSSFALGWVVAIIVEDSDICASICHACTQILHTSFDTSETFKCVLDCRRRGPQPSRQDRSGGGIESVVFSRKSPTP